MEEIKISVCPRNRHIDAIVIIGIIHKGIKVLDHLLCELNVNNLLGECAIPIISGEIGHGYVISIIVVEICISNLICNFSSVKGYRIGLLIKLFVYVFIYERYVTVSIHTVSGIITLCRKNIINCIVRIGSSGKIIIAVLKDICLCIVRIVGCERSALYSDSKSLGLSGSKKLCFAKAYELHRGLLHTMDFVILSIGRLTIDLHGFLA